MENFTATEGNEGISTPALFISLCVLAAGIGILLGFNNIELENNEDEAMLNAMSTFFDRA